MLGEFLSAIFDVSVRAGADVRQERRRHEANSRAASPRGRRVLGIKDWNEVCEVRCSLHQHAVDYARGFDRCGNASLVVTPSVRFWATPWRCAED